MFPLGGNCFVPASRVCDPATGARYRAARLLEGLSHQDVADRGNTSAIVVDNETYGVPAYWLTPELVQKLEKDPGETAIWVFEAVAHGIGRSATEIMEMEMTKISPDGDNSSGSAMHDNNL
jgi:hypothetical protein